MAQIKTGYISGLVVTKRDRIDRSTSEDSKMVWDMFDKDVRI